MAGPSAAKKKKARGAKTARPGVKASKKPAPRALAKKKPATTKKPAKKRLAKKRAASPRKPAVKTKRKASAASKKRSKQVAARSRATPRTKKRAASKKVAPRRLAAKAAKKVAAKKVAAKSGVRGVAPSTSARTNGASKQSTASGAYESGPASTRAADRLMATCAELPVERALTDEERAAMSKVAETARRFVGASAGAPEEVVDRIALFVDEVRGGRRPEPKSQDVRLGLGVLWGEQLRAQAGWSWVHLTYPDGFASYALVPDDRAFACFPLNRVPEAMRADARTNTSSRVFDSIRTGSLPTRKANAYLVIG